jgi:hypothetical protein
LRRALAPALALTIALAALAGPPPGRAAGAAGCRPAQARAVVERFVALLNAGRLRELDRLFGALGVFRWYSTTAPGARLGEEAKRRETLIPYLRARVRAGERLRVELLRWSGAEPDGSLAHVAGALRRSARGVPPRTYLFRAAAECSSGEPLLVAWSMGGPL